MARLVVATVAALTLIIGCNASSEVPVGGSYVDPEGLFRVDVPEMRNPFVKAPSRTVARRAPAGGADVTFSVVDLGEAWRFGVRGATANSSDSSLADLCDAELERWRHDGPPVTPPIVTDPAAFKPRVLLEDTIAFVETAGLARVYHVDNASMIFRHDDGRARPALIDVAVARTDAGYVLFAVAQFDMPMEQWDFFINDVKRRPESVLETMANDDMKALRVRVASLRGAPGSSGVER